MAEKSTVKPITGFRTQAGDAPYDFNALANKPTPDTTLKISGVYPDSKAVGDKITNIEKRITEIQGGDALAGITINNKKLSENPVLTASDVGAAATQHKHSASDLVGGTLPMEIGGTNANNGKDGLKNLLAAGHMILSDYQYGDRTPPIPETSAERAAMMGRIFFVKV